MSANPGRVLRAVLHDWPWKLFSVLAAAVLWYVAINVTNPVTVIPVTKRLELRGLEQLADERRLVVNEAALAAMTVQINVRCKQSDAAGIQDKLEAYLDFSTMDWLSLRQTGQPVTTQPSVDKKNAADDFEIMDVSPRNVSVTIDRQVTYSRSVTASPGTTELPDGYVYITPITVSPTTINMTGAESQIAKVTSVAVAVDLTDKTDSFQTVGRIHAYDAEGKELFVKLGDTMATVSVTVNKLGHAAVARPTVSGEPAAGFVVTGISYNLKELQLMGTEADLALLAQVKLEPVDISGATATVRKTYDLRDTVKGTKLNVVNGTDYECEVAVTIERLVEKAFTIPIESLNTSGYTEDAKIMADFVLVRVQGTRADIDKLSEVSASIDLSGLADGENDVPVVVAPINGITVVEQTETLRVVVGPEAPFVPDETEGAD